jgi:hypothetical protein
MTAHQKTLAVICFALSTGIGMFVYRQTSMNSENLEPSAVLEENPSALEEQELPPSTQATPITEVQLQLTPELKTQLFVEYRCQKAACDLSPFLAENEDEALWLRARGYPSPRQREEAKRLPTVELKLRAEKGDLVAASLYGERLMEENDWNGAHNVLLKAASEGSLYSLYALSYRAANHPQHRSRIEAGKWLRLAYLAGDYKSTIQLVQIYPPVNEMPEQLLIDRYAAHSYRKFLRYRSYPRPPSEE